jgi:hypothetical protein
MFIPTSKEVAEQAGMRVVCAKFLWASSERKLENKGAVIRDKKTRRYTSTGPSLADSAPGETSEGPHAVIDSDAYVGGSSDVFGDVSGRHPTQVKPQGILMGSTRINSSIMATVSLAITGAGTSLATATTTDSVNMSPTPNPTGFTGNVFGAIKENEENNVNKEHSKRKHS